MTTLVCALLGWLLVLVAAAGALVSVFARVPWASGELTSSRAEGFNSGDLVNRAPAGVGIGVVVAVLGLLLAACLGAAALAHGRTGRVAVTVGAGLALLVLGAVQLVSASALGTDPGEGLLLLLVVPGVPLLVMVLLAWRGARRGAARTAVVLCALAVVGAGYVLLNLVSGLADVEVGAWAALLLAVVGLVGAVLLLRSLPPRPRPLEPGDPGWTA